MEEAPTSSSTTENAMNVSKESMSPNTSSSTENSKIKVNSLLVQNIIAHIQNPVDHIQITACIPQYHNYIIVDTINQIVCNENYSNYQMNNNSPPSREII